MELKFQNLILHPLLLLQILQLNLIFLIVLKLPVIVVENKLFVEYIAAFAFLILVVSF